MTKNTKVKWELDLPVLTYKSIYITFYISILNILPWNSSDVSFHGSQFNCFLVPCPPIHSSASLLMQSQIEWCTICNKTVPLSHTNWVQDQPCMTYCITYPNVQASRWAQRPYGIMASYAKARRNSKNKNLSTIYKFHSGNKGANVTSHFFGFL